MPRHPAQLTLGFQTAGAERIGTVERQSAAAGLHRLLGVDEVGRGCLAGPVVAAAVALPADHGLVGIDDSKCVPKAARQRLAEQIRASAVALGVGEVDAGVIDEVNILQASLRAMALAVEAACARGFRPELVLVDGNRSAPLAWPQRTVIGGDRLSLNIAAASIVAKVHRDALMTAAHAHYPAYGFARHVGYATAGHLAALHAAGPCPLHRRSFAPVAAVLARSAAAAAGATGAPRAAPDAVG